MKDRIHPANSLPTPRPVAEAAQAAPPSGVVVPPSPVSDPGTLGSSADGLRGSARGRAIAAIPLLPAKALPEVRQIGQLAIISLNTSSALGSELASYKPGGRARIEALLALSDLQFQQALAASLDDQGDGAGNAVADPTTRAVIDTLQRTHAGMIARFREALEHDFPMDEGKWRRLFDGNAQVPSEVHAAIRPLPEDVRQAVRHEIRRDLRGASAAARNLFG